MMTCISTAHSDNLIKGNILSEKFIPIFLVTVKIYKVAC